MSEDDNQTPEPETVPPPPPVQDNPRIGEYFERGRQPREDEEIVRKDDKS
jgi:hypothetical protein